MLGLEQKAFYACVGDSCSASTLLKVIPSMLFPRLLFKKCSVSTVEYYTLLPS